MEADVEPTVEPVVEPVVGLIENEALVKASISVIKTADELLGSIIDINA